jgi:hypothetical protein
LNVTATEQTDPSPRPFIPLPFHSPALSFPCPLIPLHPPIPLPSCHHKNLAGALFFLSLPAVLVFLRLIGIANAAAWFGAVFFFTFVVSPAFLSGDILQILPRSHAEAVSQIVARNFYKLQYWCGFIAIAHLVGEWLYAGRSWQRLTVYLVGAILVLALFGGAFLRPKQMSLHAEIYGQRATAAQQEQARKWLGFWQGTAQFVNFLSMAGLLAYLWQIARPVSDPRFSSVTKFRG